MHQPISRIDLIESYAITIRDKGLRGLPIDAIGNDVIIALINIVVNIVIKSDDPEKWEKLNQMTKEITDRVQERWGEFNHDMD